MTVEQYPGADDGMNSSYTEKHHFGYRWYDQNKVKPAYEFGFGLSYTKFQYSNLKLDKVKKTVSLLVKNIGKMPGAEIVQVYLSVPETKNFYGGYRSPKALQGFEKTAVLQPGATGNVSITLPERAFSFWSVESQKWVQEAGTYKILVGASSRDIRMATSITIEK